MKYNYFQDEKLEYEDIEIPDELLFMVRQTVAADRRKKAAGRRMRILKTAGSVAAVLFLCLTIGVNSSYAFAETAVKIPIVKSVAKAVVVRSYRPEIIEVYEQNKISWQPEKTPAQNGNVPEEQPEEIMPALSGNDLIVQEEETEKQPAEQEAAVVLEGVDAWKAEMTPEKLREVTELYTPDLEEKYADTPEKLRTILLAELPEKDISLYGYHEDGGLTGAVLRIGDVHQYFDWNYMNESEILPEIFCGDIDGDGKEEITVFLYNGAVQKGEVLKEISKEEITAPDKATGEETDKPEIPPEDAQKDDSSDGTEEKPQEELSDVSDNDVKEVAENKENPEPTAGEIWVVSPRGEKWPACVLTTDDYESQIVHQLKAAYDGKKGTVQLYLMEEPLGKAVKLSVKKPENLTFEAVNPAPEREFTAEKGLTLKFRMEASFFDENNEKEIFLLTPKLEAEIHLEGDSLNVENIREV